MKITKEILKYFTIYFITVAILCSILILTSKIPKNAIKDNLKKSISFFEKNAGIDEKIKRREYTTIHYFADSVLLNIIYSIDTENPIEATMWAKYYFQMKADIHNDFINVVENDLEPNEQYLRYWHGSMMIVRPLLTLFDINQIYTINKVVMYMLALVLIALIFKKSKKTAVMFFLSMIMISFKYVPYCLEYSWTFYIMIIASIIAIQTETKGNKYIYTTSLIAGITTCFFDFLTTELITLFVPILLVILIRKEDGRLKNFKEGMKFIVISSILWGSGYVAMWCTKWVLASLILKINAMDYVLENAKLRINRTSRLKV